MTPLPAPQALAQLLESDVAGRKELCSVPIIAGIGGPWSKGETTGRCLAPPPPAPADVPAGAAEGAGTSRLSAPTARRNHRFRQDVVRTHARRPNALVNALSSHPCRNQTFSPTPLQRCTRPSCSCRRRRGARSSAIGKGKPSMALKIVIKPGRGKGQEQRRRRPLIVFFSFLLFSLL